MIEGPDELATRRRAVSAASGVLKSVPLDRRVAWLCGATEKLLHTSQAAAGRLAESAGLSEPMVEWALQTTLRTVDEPVLRSVAHELGASGRRLLEWLPVILAGNLFTATVRGVCVPLLAGVPVLAKASSREALFPELLLGALSETDAELSSAFDVVSFRGGDEIRERALVGDAAAIAVYGSDDTVRDVRGRHPGARVIPHGHGVSVAYCSRGSRSAGATFDALALDVSAYDQRGCLSPQAIYVEGDFDDAVRFGARLAEDGLEPLSATLPRGPLPLDVGAAQAQWRGLAEVEGRMFRGDSFAIAVVDRRTLRWSPGHRNVSVVPVESLDAAFDDWKRLGSTLKCVGVDSDALDACSAGLRRAGSLNAYACQLGTMQTPSFDAPADGHPPWYGLTD